MTDQRTTGDGDGSETVAGERVADGAADPRGQYAELTHKQPNTVGTEPGARLKDLKREGAATGDGLPDAEPAPAATTEAPAASGVYRNKFSTEGARIHGTPDGRDRPGESRPGAWRPDETKSIDTGIDPDDSIA